MIAKIAVSAAVYAIDKPYSYVVPPGMTLLPGVRVMVPFGRGNRSTEGMVLSLEEGDEAELKCVDRALDPEPVLDDAMLRLSTLLCGNGISVPFMRPFGRPFRWGFGIRFRTPLPWPAASPGRERPSGKQMPSGCWRCWRIWGARGATAPFGRPLPRRNPCRRRCGIS
ncbi:MAG: hypothetical protein ACLU9S_06375 [Oscillospiraceae bacterium]